MEKLTTSHDLEKIISLYEVESKRKSSVFSSIIDKVKSLFSKEITFSPKTTTTPIPSPIIPEFYKAQPIEEIETMMETKLENTLEENTDFNLESLQEFFKQNLSIEQEELLSDLFVDEEKQLKSTQELHELNLEQDIFQQHPQPEFSANSYFQRIQKHAALESKNEQLWRRRQAILNGDGTSS